MLDKFNITYGLSRSSFTKNSLVILYKKFKRRHVYDIATNHDDIYLLKNFKIVGLEIYCSEYLEQYKNICIYDLMNCHIIPEDILDCFSWVIEKDYINKIRIFE